MTTWHAPGHDIDVGVEGHPVHVADVHQVGRPALPAQGPDGSEGGGQQVKHGDGVVLLQAEGGAVGLSHGRGWVQALGLVMNVQYSAVQCSTVQYTIV